MTAASVDVLALILDGAGSMEETRFGVDLSFC